MNEFASRIEALEHRWMRAWTAGDRGEMKTLASRDFVTMFGSQMPTILDRTSWLAATETRLRCANYRFGSVYVRRHGKSAFFAAPMDLELTIDREPVMRKALVTSIWQRTAVRRRWHLVERVIGGLIDSDELPGAIRSMQLWR